VRACFRFIVGRNLRELAVLVVRHSTATASSVSIATRSVNKSRELEAAECLNGAVSSEPLLSRFERKREREREREGERSSAFHRRRTNSRPCDKCSWFVGMTQVGPAGFSPHGPPYLSHAMVTFDA